MSKCYAVNKEFILARFTQLNNRCTTVVLSFNKRCTTVVLSCHQEHCGRGLRVQWLLFYGRLPGGFSIPSDVIRLPTGSIDSLNWRLSTYSLLCCSAYLLFVMALDYSSLLVSQWGLIINSYEDIIYQSLLCLSNSNDKIHRIWADVQPVRSTWIKLQTPPEQNRVLLLSWLLIYSKERSTH